MNASKKTKARENPMNTRLPFGVSIIQTKISASPSLLRAGGNVTFWTSESLIDFLSVVLEVGVAKELNECKVFDVRNWRLEDNGFLELCRTDVCVGDAMKRNEGRLGLIV